MALWTIVAATVTALVLVSLYVADIHFRVEELSKRIDELEK